MSLFQKLGSFFSLHEEEDGDYDGMDAPAPKRNVVNLSDANRRPVAGGASVGVFAPRSFAEVTEIADALRGRQVVIVNLQGADRGLLQRVVDFTSGVAYTIDGRIQKLADAIYLIVPAGVSVSAAGLRDSLDNDGMLDLGAKVTFGTNRG